MLSRSELDFEKNKEKIGQRSVMSAIKEIEPFKFGTKNTDFSVLLSEDEEDLDEQTHSSFLPFGHSLLTHPIIEYIQKVFINFYNPTGNASQKVFSWIQGLLNVNMAYNSGTFDVTVGSLFIYKDAAASVIKWHQRASKEYVVKFQLHASIYSVLDIINRLKSLKCIIHKKPSAITAFDGGKFGIKMGCKTELLIRDQDRNVGLFCVSNGARITVRTLSEHIGFMISGPENMMVVKRGHTRHKNIDIHMVSEYHDGNPFFLTIKPEENLRIRYKKIMILASAINGVCYGEHVHAHEVLKCDDEIEINEEIEIVSLKGETVGIAISLMTSTQIAVRDIQTCAILKEVIMRRDRYPRNSGLRTLASRESLRYKWYSQKYKIANQLKRQIQEAGPSNINNSLPANVVEDLDATEDETNNGNDNN